MSANEIKERMDRVIAWVKNCDTKASILLSVCGVILSVLLTKSGVLGTIGNIIVAFKGNPDCCRLVFLIISCIMFLLTILFIGLSVYYYISVLKAKMNEDQTGREYVKHDSLIHFHHISQMEYSAFKDVLKNEDENSYEEDLISQLYINSCRCREKFEFLNKGILSMQWGFACGLVFLLLSFFV